MDSTESCCSCAGELGPSTIVGSAAFNMLVISAVCVVSIPGGGGRNIKEVGVFYITAAFSLFACVRRRRTREMMRARDERQRGARETTTTLT